MKSGKVEKATKAKARKILVLVVYDPLEKLELGFLSSLHLSNNKSPVASVLSSSGGLCNLQVLHLLLGRPRPVPPHNCIVPLYHRIGFLAHLPKDAETQKLGQAAPADFIFFRQLRGEAFPDHHSQLLRKVVFTLMGHRLFSPPSSCFPAPLHPDGYADDTPQEKEKR